MLEAAALPVCSGFEAESVPSKPAPPVAVESLVVCEPRVLVRVAELMVALRDMVAPVPEL